MAEQKLVGQNYTVPDLVAKVTGKSKYAEDFRAEGMIFAKLLLSPLPHARVTRLDLSAALAMPGVKAIADRRRSAEAGRLHQRQRPGHLRQSRWRGRAHERARLPGPADPGGCRGRRGHRGRRDRKNRDRVRAAALHRRSAGEPPSGRPQRQNQGQLLVHPAPGAARAGGPGPGAESAPSRNPRGEVDPGGAG